MHGQHDHGGDGFPNILPPHIWRRVLVVTGAIAVVLGTHGYYVYMEHEPGGSTLTNALYHTAQLFILHAPHFEGPVPWTLQTARWLAPATLLISVGGLLRRMFHEERSRRTLQRLKGHVVVCGLGRKGMELVRQLRSREPAGREQVVVIDRDPPVELQAECRRLGAHVLTEDATRPDALRNAGVHCAKKVFAVCPEDATNCEIATQVARLKEDCGGEWMDCYVHLGTAELGETLQQALAARMTAGQARLHAVDAFDPEALALLVHGLPLDHDGIRPDDPRGVRLVILGFGRMGRALAVRAAQLGQFANGRRVRIEVIDRRAGATGDALLFHHPQIGKAADLDFHEHEALSPIVRELIEGFCADPDYHTSIAVCFDNEALALELCLRLLPLLDSDAVRLAVRMEHDSGLAHLIEKLRRGGPRAAASMALASEEAQARLRQLSRLHTFGTSEQFRRLSDRDRWPLEHFARRFHETYVRMVLDPLRGDPAALEQARNKPELQPWADLSHDLRDSNRQQADHTYIKMRALGCEIVPDDDPRPAVDPIDDDVLPLLAELEHNRWNAERWVAGWVQGEPKDVARRRNPHLVSWDELRPEIQDYDRVFVANIPTYVRSAGMKIVRQGASPS